tara:strand:- start:2810 stop:3247 length:438 start_codon:yes stop_codon:yes gene_type:complete
MSREYAEKKIKEALVSCGGNIALARQQVIAWAKSDPQLLNALVRPHLNGIVSYQVERVASGRSEPKIRVEESPRRPQQGQGEEFGMDILRAVAASGAAIFGQESNAAPMRKVGTVSKQHIDAMKQIAAMGEMNVKKAGIKRKPNE